MQNITKVTSSIIYYSTLIFLLCHCAEQEKLTYTLNTDNTLHQFKSNDGYAYQILGVSDDTNGIVQDIFGEMQVTWTSSPLTQDPNNNEIIESKLETTDSTLSDSNGDTQQQYIKQDDEGSLILLAETDRSGNLLWVFDPNQNQYSHTLLTSPLGSTEHNIDSSYDLKKCEPATQQCQSVSTVSLQVLYNQPMTTGTPYATFETYVYTIIKEYTHYTEPPALSTLKIIQDIWIYPPLGIVKYRTIHNTSNSQLNYSAKLAKTNVKFQ